MSAFVICIRRAIAPMSRMIDRYTHLGRDTICFVMLRSFDVYFMVTFEYSGSTRENKGAAKIGILEV